MAAVKKPEKMSETTASGCSSEKDMLSENGEGTTMARPIVMPDEYTGEDWIDWITNFELCARINDWDDAAKTSFLAAKLKRQAHRQAQPVYRDLSRP